MKENRKIVIVLSIFLAIVIAAIVVLAILTYRNNNKLRESERKMEKYQVIISEEESRIQYLNKKINDGEKSINNLNASIDKKDGKIKKINKKISDKGNLLNKTSDEVAKMIDIEETYDVLKWFNGLGSPKTNSKMKITDTRCNTMAKMKTFLGNYFSPEYTTKLLDMDAYSQKKDGLYYTSGERGGRIDYLYCKYRFKNVSKDKRTIDCTICTWKNFEEYPKEIAEEHLDYEQVKVNGKWVFSKIELPY